MNSFLLHLKNKWEVDGTNGCSELGFVILEREGAPSL